MTNIKKRIIAAIMAIAMIFALTAVCGCSEKMLDEYESDTFELGSVK